MYSGNITHSSLINVYPCSNMETIMISSLFLNESNVLIILSAFSLHIILTSLLCTSILLLLKASFKSFSNASISTTMFGLSSLIVLSTFLITSGMS